MKQLSVLDLAQMLTPDNPSQPVIIDVREPWEVEIAQLPGSVFIPMGEIPARAEDLKQDLKLDEGLDRPIVCLCHHGMRSMQVAVFLERFGHENIYNLTGGIHAWANQVDINCATY